MFRLIPREENFFELFERAADNVHEASVAFLEFLEKYDDRIERAKHIKDLEHAGDALTHQTIERLNRTFITPIDREDIHELICRLDDIVDLIDTAANRMVLYRIEAPTDDAIALARCLRHGTAILKEAMPMLRDMSNLKNLQDRVIAIHTQENEADNVLSHALATLFDSNPDPIQIIKWKDVYQDIESATDRCEDVANILDTIMLKHA